MATHDYVIANQGFPSFRSDLNSVLQAVVSNNSGASEPSTKYAYQMWYETDTNNWYMRNADNDAWITLATFNQTNDTVNFIDSSATVAGISTSASATVITLANGSVALNPAGFVSVGGAATQSGEIRFLEDTDNGANYINIKITYSKCCWSKLYFNTSRNNWRCCWRKSWWNEFYRKFIGWSCNNRNFKFCYL